MVCWWFYNSVILFHFFTFGSLGSINVYILLLKAPVTFITEPEQVASSALTDQKKLEELQWPRLKILFVKGQQPYEYRQPGAGYEGRGQRIFRIGIKNDSNIFLSECKVRLEEMTGFQNPHLPVTLKQQHDNPQINPSDPNSMDYKQAFDLRSQQTEYIDVAQMNELNPNSPIQLCYARQKGYPWHFEIPRGNYTLTIKAFAGEGTFAEEKFKLAVDDGFLQFEINQLG